MRRKRFCPARNPSTLLPQPSHLSSSVFTLTTMNAAQNSKLNPLALPFIPFNTPPSDIALCLPNLPSHTPLSRRDIKVKRYHVPGLPRGRSTEVFEQEMKLQSDRIAELEARLKVLEDKLRGLEGSSTRTEAISDHSCEDNSYEGPNVFLMFGI